VRDAERKGFVKLSDTVAGIAVDWTAKPLRIVGVRGTAADAGVRNGDILIELDGSEITEPFSIFRIMSTKHPGDKLTVKVLRADRQLYFAYTVMQREKTHLPSAPQS
jgi:type II secretory pathway component PulC